MQIKANYSYLKNLVNHIFQLIKLAGSELHPKDCVTYLSWSSDSLKSKLFHGITLFSDDKLDLAQNK